MVNTKFTREQKDDEFIKILRNVANGSYSNKPVFVKLWKTFCEDPSNKQFEQITSSSSIETSDINLDDKTNLGTLTQSIEEEDLFSNEAHLSTTNSHCRSSNTCINSHIDSDEESLKIENILESNELIVKKFRVNLAQMKCLLMINLALMIMIQTTLNLI